MKTKKHACFLTPKLLGFSREVYYYDIRDFEIFENFLSKSNVVRFVQHERDNPQDSLTNNLHKTMSDGLIYSGDAVMCPQCKTGWMYYWQVRQHFRGNRHCKNVRDTKMKMRVNVRAEHVKEL
jgi:hypothetical protein